MLKQFTNKIKNISGFSLAETLMAVLILLMVSAVVAGGIPSAANAMKKIIDGSNAQSLLSITMTRLRAELSLASADGIEISADGKSITYVSGLGRKSRIYMHDDGIHINEDVNVTPSRYDHLLVSEAAANKNLRALCVFAYDGNGLITVSNLNVFKAGSEAQLASIPEYSIKVISFIAP